MARFLESIVWEAARNPMTMHSLLVEGVLVPEEGTYMCWKCGHPLKLYHDASRVDGLKWVCTFSEKVPKKKGKKVCGMAASYRFNTWFSRSHLSICEIISFCRLWLSGVNVSDISKFHLGINVATCYAWAAHCSEVAFDYCLSAKEKLGGPGKIVDFHESKFGKSKNHQVHRLKGQWVLSGYEHGSGRIFMACIDEVDRETVVPLIEEWIEPGTTIRSDCWKASVCLGDLAYNQLKDNHKINFSDEKSGTKIMHPPGQHNSHTPGNISRYLLRKRCLEQRLEVTQVFLRHAGKMYNPCDPCQPSSEVGDSSCVADDPSPFGAASHPSSGDNPFWGEEDEQIF